MKILFVVLPLFIALNAQAKPDIYKIEMDLFIEGLTEGSRMITIEEGKEGQVTSELDGVTSTVKVLAKSLRDKKEPTVELNFEVSTLSKNGERTILSKPRFIVLVGKTAEIETTESNGDKILRLRTKATRL